MPHKGKYITINKPKLLMTLKSTCLFALALWLLWPHHSVQAQTAATRYRVACCDWMMLKRQKLGEFALSKRVGADGVELDMGPLGRRVMFDNQLRDPAQARRFRHVADSLGIAVPSVAMSGFFAQDFITRPNYLDLTADCLNTMQHFGSKVAFLPLSGSGKDWHRAGARRDSLVARLHRVGEMARRRGLVIGIRTSLDAEAMIRLLKEIKSKGIGIYYNFQDAADHQRDIPAELKKLGRRRIVQIHASNTDSVNLREDPEIDLPAIRRTLDRMGWKGWLVVERSRDVSKVRDVAHNFSRNVAYIKEVFR